MCLRPALRTFSCMPSSCSNPTRCVLFSIAAPFPAAMAFYNTAIYIGRGIMYKLVDKGVDAASPLLPAMSVPVPLLTDGAGNL